jgi:hypothetical protein
VVGWAFLRGPWHYLGLASLGERALPSPTLHPLGLGSSLCPTVISAPVRDLRRTDLSDKPPGRPKASCSRRAFSRRKRGPPGQRCDDRDDVGEATLDNNHLPDLARSFQATDGASIGVVAGMASGRARPEENQPEPAGHGRERSYSLLAPTATTGRGLAAVDLSRGA